jgi:hypothetical protein
MSGPAVLQSRRAQEVSRAGRRTNLSCQANLDSSEHGGTLNAVRMTIRGELACGRGYQSRHNLVFDGSKDPNHDAVMRIGSKARGPILFLGTKATGLAGGPPPRTVIGDPSQRADWVETVHCLQQPRSSRRAQNDAIWHHALSHRPPQAFLSRGVVARLGELLRRRHRRCAKIVPSGYWH